MKYYFPTILFFFWIAATAQKVKTIELLNANLLTYEKKEGEDVKKLLGNVIFKHGDALMYCDSAYMYTTANRVEAFHHVHINKNDSVHIYGDMLHYDGNNRFAEIRKNVKMESAEFLLFGEELFYDMRQNRAHYSNGAIIEDKSNRSILHSRTGYYFTGSRLFFFKNSVRLVHPDYIITTDTLKYDPERKITWFFGPTNITSDTTVIYCEHGWFDTKNDLAMFRSRAEINSGKEQLRADSIWYERKAGRGKAFGNVQFTDTVEDMVISGDYGRYEENFSSSVVTGRAMMILIFGDDSLFLHGDTLKAFEDSVTDYRTFYAYHRVRFFKSDLQGACDSVVYSQNDSLIYLFTEPVLWSDENQLTGDSILIRMKGGEIHSMHMDNNAFIVSLVALIDSASCDSTGYNQIQGRKMTGYFTDSHLRKVDVKGNGKTIYYVEDEKDGFLGVNKTECSDMIIWVTGGDDDEEGKRQKIDRISFLTKPEATLFPMNELTPDDLYLKEFLWYGNRRPVSKDDIFRITE